MDDNPRWWQLAQNIEGLITRLGVHASGVVCIDGDVNEYCSLMKTKNGQLVTSFELHNADRVGLIKYDYLTVSALDRIHQCMNYMLENGQMEWQGDLKSTYLKYLDPSKLDYETEEMWDMAADGKIRSLFQFDTVVGGQSIAKIRPKSLKQLAISNSVMRLMSDGDEQPLDIYVKQKAVPEIWYNKMRNAGLTMQEIKILEKYLKEKNGVADSQEVLMQLSMDPGISNFSMKDANALRKTIAKKKFDQIEAIHKKFNEQGLAALNRQEFLDFVWKDCVELQLGYSFSTVHTTAYSIIAVQEMNLAYHFPIIYWNCACLSIDSSAVSDEDFYNLVDEDIIELDDTENKKVQNKMDYSKIATALDSFKRDGIKIRLPLVNESRLGFTPNEKDNEILYGLKGITKVTDPAIEQIMMNRTFNSFDEFLSRVTKKIVSKDKIINLIKCGGFDDLGVDKRELMKQYLTMTSEPKKNLTLQNANMLIDLNVLPPELEFEGDVYKLTKELRKHRDENKMWYAVDELEIPSGKFEKWQEIVRDSNVPAVSMLFNGSPRQVIDSSKWDRYYDSQMEHIRTAIKKDKENLLARLNQKLFENEWNKYASGDNLQWELDSINFYFSGHPLDNVLPYLPVAVDKLEDIVEDAQDGEFYIKGKVIPKMKLYTIAGTVIDKNTTKSTITVQTPDGVVIVKIYKNLFSTLGATLSSDTESGEKLIEQEGFFEKGTHLLITGIKRGSTFVPKVYKNTGRNSVLKINLDENGRFLNLEEKQDVE